MSINNDKIIKALAFEKIVIELLKRDNPTLNEDYSEKTIDNSYRYYDAVLFSSINLQAFGLETINANRIVVEIKAGRPPIDILRRFISKEETNFDVVVFIIAGKIPKDVREKIRSDKCQIFFITEDELKRNTSFKKHFYSLDEAISSDDSVLLDDNYSLLGESKNNLAFALGAGCSRASNISDWKTLSKALGFEMLYSIVDTKESMYKNKLITDALNDDVFMCFDSNSALDAIYSSFNILPNSTRESYWLSIKKVLYMSYDSPADAKQPLLDSVVACIKRNGIQTVINYNFDSVLEQNIDPNYKSKKEEIESSTTNICGCKIHHVHGYIPYDYNGKAEVRHFVFTDKEYYDNMMDPNSYTNTIQDKILQTKNVIFIGVSFTDANMKERLRKRVELGCSNKVFAFLKLPTFNFEGTNNRLMENKYRLIFQHYFQSLGVRILWVHNFDEIPKRINSI